MSQPSSSRASPIGNRPSASQNNTDQDRAIGDDGMGEVDAFLEEHEDSAEHDGQDRSTGGTRASETFGSTSYGDGRQQYELVVASRSQYYLPTSERLRGVANRILFSRYYIIFYLAMTGLSLATVIISLLEGGCPSTTWHILEIIVNGGMVLEVGTRWVGFGKQYPLTPLNILDLVLTVLCVLTLLLVFLNPCGAGSKREEVLDTMLLFFRNGVQFWRLGSILRRSGHSLLHPPRPIDLSQAREAALDLELDMDDDEAVAEHHMSHTSGDKNGYSELSTVERGETFFDAGQEEAGQDSEGQPNEPRRGVFGEGEGQVGYQAGKDQLSQQSEEQWDRFS